MARRRALSASSVLRLRPPGTRGFLGGRALAGGRALGAALGEYILDWDDVRTAADPHATALEFARSAVQHACEICDWDPTLAASIDGTPPPLV